MKTKYVVLLLLLVHIYVGLGGLAFHYLESPIEVQDRHGARNVTRQFLVNHPCVSPEELAELLQVALVYHERGLLEIPNNTVHDQWDIISSVFFAITVITTIGYGHMTPVTLGGQAVYIVYAVVGIPLCLILLREIAKKMRRGFQLLERCVGRSGGPSRNVRATRAIRGGCFCTLGLIVFVILPSLVFWAAEGWTYFQALYYCFTTLSTVGFGDFVPRGVYGVSLGYDLSYRVFVALWIFMGLAWLAGVLSFLQDIYGQLGKKAGEIKDSIPDKIRYRRKSTLVINPDSRRPERASEQVSTVETTVDDESMTEGKQP